MVMIIVIMTMTMAMVMIMIMVITMAIIMMSPTFFIISTIFILPIIIPVTMTTHVFEDLLCSDPWKLASRVARLPPNDARKVALILTFDIFRYIEGGGG